MLYLNYFHKQIFEFNFYINFNKSLVEYICFNLSAKKVKIIDNESEMSDNVKLCFGYIEKLLSGKSVEINLDLFDLSEYTEFQKQVLFTLKDKVKFGETVSYKKLAELSGYPKSYRAVGNVMKKNRFPIIFPCHRVIKNNGETGNFVSGQILKQKLLDFEKINK
jgi:methylated-DNA-[protein]-cysteine S-methyltransferase